MSRPRKPTTLKLLSGTERPDRARIDTSKLPLLDKVPLAPDWLPNAHAIKEWDRLAKILTANKLLTEAGLSALGMMCALHGRIVQLYADDGLSTAAMAGTLRAMHNDFGLTPVSQGKISIGEAEKANPSANNGKRPGRGKS